MAQLHGGTTPKFGAIIDLLLIALLAVLCIGVADPRGNFPLNDDWSYGLTVQRLMDRGEFRPLGWVSMPLLTHVLWGGLFTSLMGFSFEVLRYATLVSAVLGVLALYGLIWEITASRRAALLCSALLGFNPVFFALSHTFMTDVPFSSLCVAAAWFLTRYLKRRSNVDYVLALGLIVAATLSRQLAIALPVSFCAILLMKDGLRNTQSVVMAWVPLALSACLLGGIKAWMSSTGRLPALYNAQSDELLRVLHHPGELVGAVSYNGLLMLVYSGLFLFPLLISVFARWLASMGARAWRTTAAAFMVVALLVVISKLTGHALHTMPMGENILFKGGIGPMVLKDVYALGLNPVPELPKLLWLAVTGLSLLGSVMLTALLMEGVATWVRNTLRPTEQEYEQAWLGMFFLLAVAVYAAPVLATHLFDRYLILVVPLMAAALLTFFPVPAPSVTTWRSLPSVLGLVLVMGLAVLATLGTKDYLSWNRVRWQALRSLMQDEHVSPARIDGGFEFNGLYLYNPSYAKTTTKSWWWVSDDQYLLACGPVPGYQIIQTYAYRHHLPSYEGKVYVLKRETLGVTQFRAH